MTGTKHVAGVRLTHEEVDASARATATEGDERAVVAALLERPAVDEAFAVETCHRVEAYVATTDPEAARRALTDVVDGGVVMDHEESIDHLLRVGAGLESVVLGEDQVLGQLRDARDAASDAGGLGPTLGPAVRKALRVGERARTETEINEGVVSLGGAAVELAGRKRDLDDASALVVGAGEMARLAANALAGAGVDSVTVANRTRQRAAELAATIDADAEGTGLSGLADRVAAADVVVTATGSAEPVLERAAFADAGETLVVDVGQPHDVAPAAGDCPGVDRYTLDDLEDVTEDTARRRERAARAVETIVDQEFDRLLEQYKRRRADDVIAAMYESAEQVRDRELETAIARLEAERDGELSAGEREVVESLADALVSQLLAAPTRSLREAAAEDDWETITTALELFDPGFDDGPATGADGGTEAAADDD